MSSYEIIADYLWMIGSFVNAILVLFIFLMTKKLSHFCFVVMFLSCGLWGLTAPDIHIEEIRVINRVILPAVAALSSIFGCILRLVEINKNFKTIEKP